MKLSDTLFYSGALILLAATSALTTSCSKDDNESSPAPDVSIFKGSDLSSIAGFKCDPSTKTAYVDIYHNGAWTLYPMINTTTADFEKPLLSGYYSGSYAIAEKSYLQYCLEYNGSRAVISPRQLPIEGQVNTRDLGGYKTKDGKYVKWGLIFRSGNLGLLTDSDVEYLGTIPLKTVIDFRSSSEKSEPDATDRVPSAVTKQIDYEISPGNLNDYSQFIEAIMNNDYEFTKQYMIDINESLIMDYSETYAAYFQDILDQNNLPLLFHCTAGKDRAGLASALFLLALGVDMETVLEDYLLTNTVKGIEEDLTNAMYYLEAVRVEYILKAFETIEQQYQSIDNYIVNILKVDTEKLKSIFLY